MTWQQWIEQNYTWLENFASVYGELSGDCLTHLCLYFDVDAKNWNKFYKIPNHEKPKWIRAFFRNQVNWINSPVSRENKVNNLSQEKIDWFENVYDSESDDLTKMEISAEDTNEAIKDWISDCYINYGPDKTDKLSKIKIIYHKNLNLAEQILFGLYFDEMLTHRQIASRLKIPLTSSFFMVKKLENKLIELCLGTQSSL